MFPAHADARESMSSPSVDLYITVPHNTKLLLYRVCVFLYGRGTERERERESLCVFTDVSKRVDCSDGCRGPGEVGGSERVCCACVIDVSWLMVGLYMKIFLFRVMGERPNSGHPRLSATLSFVITHLQVLVEECVCAYLSVVWPLWGIG